MSQNSKNSVTEQPNKSSESLTVTAPRNVLRRSPTPEALQLIPEAKARQYTALPISIENNTLQVVMAEPNNLHIIEALAALTKKRIEPVEAAVDEILDAIDFNYEAFGEIGKYFVNEEDSAVEVIGSIDEVESDSAISQTLNVIMQEAIKSRASDIHIKPESDKLHVRYRIDGILHEVSLLPSSTHNALISRIKILAGMNIADHIRPQDGQISLSFKGKSIDMRVATINTVHGEMAVLRILDKSLAALPLSQLGFLPESMEKMEQVLMMPYGMMLVSGPTGAGKTTTLYAALNSLDRVGRNIITIEDPVEYRFDGINQIQVNTRAGLTFATGLRSILRLDPDIVLVGEIRDSETAEIGIQSALTGHLVLSSVHANDTAGVLFRLIDLGIEPFLICSAVVCVVAQRMVRRVCPHCARKVTAPLVEQLAYHRETGEEQTQFLYGAGCKACTYTGYSGRTGIFEIMLMSDEIKKLIVGGASTAEIRTTAIKEGMVVLATDGMIKAKAGMTTPFEVLRNAFTIQ